MSKISIMMTTSRHVVPKNIDTNTICLCISLVKLLVITSSLAPEEQRITLCERIVLWKRMFARMSFHIDVLYEGLLNDIFDDCLGATGRRKFLLINIRNLHNLFTGRNSSRPRRLITAVSHRTTW